MSVVALLGPTNTGKTHRAVERMLEHRTGMIGLPLRLLAREVYDRVSAKVGEANVALVTGEEQRVPPRAAYVVATVEAMPEREVEIAIVDEVQLAAHDQRGHVFTSRMLGLRGTKETWLLGSEAMRGMVRELVPHARIVTHPRLSQLSYAGAAPLAKLPPRSAVVGFSMPQVYELAERLRARRGGAAVVLGALSPRTRNAQVAMFQSGEVEYLVATDAIGMGLNLDVDHVAFATLRKFDGRDVRDVEEAELAQIAGRAGRFVKDGTFGTITPTLLSNDVARAIELHSFPPVRRVRWRNDDLDFSSLAALRDSLALPPPRASLLFARGAEDAQALAMLAARPEIARLARGEERVRLLWDVCQVPDFRKLLFEAHVDFLEGLFVELARAGRLGDDLVAARVRELEGTAGDVETLVARIAAIRTWTYVSNRSTWLASPSLWQERTRAIEDRLSDALHEQLVARFVDAPKAGRRASKRRGGARPPEASRAREPVAPTVDKDHPFAALLAFRDRVTTPAFAASRPMSPDAWVDTVVDAPPGDFVVDATARVTHVPSGRACARLVAGAAITQPDAVLLDEIARDLGAGARLRLERRLRAAARDAVTEVLGELPSLTRASDSPDVRGLGHLLEQGLGTLLAAEAADLLSRLVVGDREVLEAAGVSVGTGTVYVRDGLRPARLATRVGLARAFYACPLDLPPKGAVSFVPRAGLDGRALVATGFVPFGARAVRADVLDRTLSALLAPGDAPETTTLASWLGAPAHEVPRILACAVRYRSS